MEISDRPPAAAIDLEADADYEWQFGVDGWVFAPKSDADDADLLECQRFARAWGGECSRLPGQQMEQWTCSRKHVWSAPASAVKLRHMWCPRWMCQRRTHPAKAQQVAPLPVLWMMASASGCVCTDAVECSDIHQELGWRCPAGCTFRQSLADGYGVRAWCPVCDKARQQMLQHLTTIASKRGGQCFEVPAVERAWFLDVTSHVSVRCAHRHLFNVSISELRLNYWCAQCARRAQPHAAQQQRPAKRHAPPDKEERRTARRLSPRAPHVVLGISATASREEARRAFAALAKAHHPDKCPSERKEEATRRFIEIKTARDAFCPQ